jgi:hypothetical protein
VDLIGKRQRSPISTAPPDNHVSGNPNFAKLGATILAREEVRQRMDGPQPPEDKVSTTDPARLPTITYGLGDPIKIRMGVETVDLRIKPRTHILLKLLSNL